MSIVWGRAPIARVCGNCGERIGVGDAVLWISVASVQKARCATCAGPAPPDLPAHVARVTTPMRMVPIARALPLGLSPREHVRRVVETARVLDYKARQTGEREPGEDD